MPEEPTPRPWRVDGVEISDANGEPVTPLYFNEHDMANARLIVDAVNKLDKLRDALVDIIDNLAIHIRCGRAVAPGDHVSFSIREAQAYIDQARAALEDGKEVADGH